MRGAMLKPALITISFTLAAPVVVVATGATGPWPVIIGFVFGFAGIIVASAFGDEI